MINVAGIFAVGYFFTGAMVSLLLRHRTNLDKQTQPDWVVVALAWPLLVFVVALIFLVGVVIPMWDEVDVWSPLKRS